MDKGKNRKNIPHRNDGGVCFRKAHADRSNEEDCYRQECPLRRVTIATRSETKYWSYNRIWCLRD